MLECLHCVRSFPAVVEDLEGMYVLVILAPTDHRRFSARHYDVDIDQSRRWPVDLAVRWENVAGMAEGWGRPERLGGQRRSDR